MPTQTWRATEVKGLTPAVDLRGAQGVFAVGGKNFYFDSLGPKSGFGNRLLSNFPLPLPEHVQGVRIKSGAVDAAFTFEGTQILEWDEFEQEYDIVHVTPNTLANPYRWTSGYLNGKFYFCHPAVGILVRDEVTKVTAKLVGPGVPQYPLAICIDNGRLIVIDAKFMYWSAQSNGADFEPRIGGAGFQLINERVSGHPIMCNSYSGGVLVWTTSGVMRSEFTGDEAVYRHRGINTEYRPINSFCTAQLDDNTVIVLDERGIFQSRGESPEPLTPLFNEFLIEYMRKNKLKIGQNIRIEWDDLRRMLYVMVSTSFASPLYERCFVLYPPLDKWGTFDEPHYGILPIQINANQRQGSYYGFVGADKKVRYWQEVGSREVAPGVLAPLNAELRLGLIRFDDLRDANDQMVEVTQLMIGNVVSGDSDVLVEDFNLDPGVDEDYNLSNGTEDYGFEKLNYVNHKARLIGTVDGSTRFDESQAHLTRFTPAMRYYSCSCVGIWHILEIKADEVGEMFHMRNFELTAAYAGRIS